jgi:2-iminobutanoate/2-iminopropanoate deaminase
MAKEIIVTSEAPRPHSPFSQAVKAAGLIFVSGQGPFHPITGDVVGSTIQEQTAQCLRNVEAILHAAGSSLAHAVSATFIMAEGEDFAAFNEEWARWFPDNPPARQAAQLPVRPKGMKISVALIAEA